MKIIRTYRELVQKVQEGAYRSKPLFSKGQKEILKD